MISSFLFPGARVGAMTLALALCWGVTGCSDDGETMDGETTGDAETTGDETTGGDTAECLAFCDCMVAQCSEFEAYPFADPAACTTFCGDLSSVELTCFSGFCEDAAVEPNMGLQEHWCEHAWGELGTDKC